MFRLLLGLIFWEGAKYRANHFSVFRDSGLTVNQYRYYDKKNIGLDLEGMVEDIKVSPEDL